MAHKFPLFRCYITGYIYPLGMPSKRCDSRQVELKISIQHDVARWVSGSDTRPHGVGRPATNDERAEGTEYTRPLVQHHVIQRSIIVLSTRRYHIDLDPQAADQARRLRTPPLAQNTRPDTFHRKGASLS